MFGFGLNISNRAKNAGSRLLDVYSGAYGAYSLRRISSSYSGSAIRVRRSSDNAEQDIGFTTNGDLNVTALTSFVGSNNGFISKLYDQSTIGAHLEQPSGTLQPVIVLGGSVVYLNSKPAIRFGALSNYNQLYAQLASPVTFDPSTRQSVYGVFGFNNKAASVYPRFWTQNSSFASAPYDYQQGWLPFVHEDPTDKVGVYVQPTGFYTTFTVSDNTQYLFSSFKTGDSEVKIALQNNSLTTSSTGVISYGAPISYIAIGGALSSPNNEFGFFYFQETINYYLDNSSSRTGINNLMNNYYGAY